MSINEYKRAGAVKDYQNYMKMAVGGFMMRDPNRSNKKATLQGS